MQKNIIFYVVATIVVIGGIYWAVNQPAEETSTESENVTEVVQTSEENLDSEVGEPQNNPPVNQIETNESTPATTEEDSSDTLSTQTSNVTYAIPRGGTGTIEVTVDADQSGTITDLSYKHKNVEPSSLEHHQNFDNADIPSQLIGQNIADVEDVFISGASLTSGGFNEALANIQSQL